MARINKLFDKLRNNLTNVRFSDTCKIAQKLGFIHKSGKGSHKAFSKPGESLLLNFQNRNGYIPAIKQNSYWR